MTARRKAFRYRLELVGPGDDRALVAECDPPALGDAAFHTLVANRLRDFAHEPLPKRRRRLFWGRLFGP